MFRTPISLSISDLSQFSKTLSKQWPTEKPSHLTMMNWLAKAAGFKNYQQLKAESDASQASLSADEKRWKRLLNDQYQITRWPSKRKDQIVVLWFIYARLPSFSDHSQSQIDEQIQKWAIFGDHVILRRELVEMDLIGRDRAGQRYWHKFQSIPELYVGFASLSSLLVKSKTPAA